MNIQDIISESNREVELMRTGLSGMKFPINKQTIQTYVEQNKAKIEDADSVINAIGKLPSTNKEYANIQEILKPVYRNHIMQMDIEKNKE